VCSGIVVFHSGMESWAAYGEGVVSKDVVPKEGVQGVDRRGRAEGGRCVCLVGLRCNDIKGMKGKVCTA
jgi:hypothetical protein